MTALSPVFEKLPPQDIESEVALLGSLLIDKEAIIRVADLIEPEDFYKDTHQIIFRAMFDVWEAHNPIDILSVANRLKELKKLKDIGGRSYLATLAQSVPTASHVDNYAQIVHKKSVLRKVITTSGEIARMAYAEEKDAIKVLDQAEQKLFGVGQKFLRQNFVSIKDTLARAFERLDELMSGSRKLRGVPTGFKSLDNVLAGLQPAELVIIAARPSIGKSAITLDMARHAAVEHKVPVGIFSLEMSKDQVSDRLVCAEAGVNLWKVRTGNLSKKDDGEFQRLNKAFGKLSEAPIYIDDTPITGVAEIRAKARRLKSEHGLGLLIIDYLQLMEGSGSKENRTQEVAGISRALKGIGRELDIPVIAVSQLSRAPEARTPAIPKLSDLRESGSLEQDADVVMFLYRKTMDKGIRECPPEEKHIAEVHIAKHRHGPAGGTIKLFFEETTASFKDLAKNQEFEQPEAGKTGDPF